MKIASIERNNGDVHVWIEIADGDSLMSLKICLTEEQAHEVGTLLVLSATPKSEKYWSQVPRSFR